MDRYVVVLAGPVWADSCYTLGTWIMAKFGGRLPLGTFLINVSGAFLIGLLMTVLTERMHPHPNWRLYLVVGVLGGYATFSSFEYETYQAVRDGARAMGLLYVAGSVLGGYLAVWLGAILVARR